MVSSLSSGSDYEHMFELAPVSLWLEDFSELKRLFDGWRAQGVTDIRSHLAEDPARLRQCSASLRVLQVNRRTLELFSADSQQHLEANLDKVFRDDRHDTATHELAQLWDGQLEFSNQTVNYALDGRRLDVLVRARILPGHEDDWSRVLVSLEDNTQQYNGARQIQRSEQYARGLFEHSPVSLWVEDFSVVKSLLDGVRAQGIGDFKTFLKVHPDFVGRCMQEIRVIDVNQQTLRMFGAASKDMLLNNIGRVFRGEMHESFAEQLQDLWDGKTFQQREVVNYSLSGDAVNIHMQFAVLDSHLHDWGLVLLSLVDITARKKAEAYLEYLGKHDVLTQLRNRAFYAEELNRLTRKGPWPLSVIAIDLNGLKVVNDEQGHAAGDSMLRRVGEVLAKAVDAPACAARIGGDEFTVLLPGTDERGAHALQERIISMLELNNQFYPGQHLSLAMGIASCQSGDAVEAAINRADQAMYAEKNRYYQQKNVDRRHPSGT
ncbi:GGDEF domain-containing protein [Acidovorax sp. FJL06]|uniref:sensor domain-containing diguanylate cyclase n=1 Tax=Acidovorax sp. FJL06 TaxID=2153365 RepID=UPI000F56450A|nr:GGDEF domain-containing protein [Acidovorax sp. FJL06]RQO80365.1 histidine kinase [Acidovorax sp. FJL06]